MKKVLLMGIVLLLAVSVSASIVDYQYNDDENTDWKSVAQTGTDSGQWNFNLAEGLTDGLGNAHLAATKDWTRDHYLDATLTSGVYLLEFGISSWDLNESVDTSGIGFAIGDSAENVNIKLKAEARNSGADLRVVSTSEAAAKRKVISGAGVSVEGISLLVEIDLDNQLMNSYYKFYGDAEWTALEENAVYSSDIAKIRFLVEGSTPWGGDDYMDLDYMTLSIPEPATLALLALGGLLSIRRKR